MIQKHFNLHFLKFKKLSELLVENIITLVFRLKLCKFKKKFKFEDLIGINSFLLQFNIDGLPLYKSSSGQIWPILATIENLTYNKPFTVALF